MLEYRQRHPNGNQEMEDQIKRHFQLPFDVSVNSGNPELELVKLKYWIYLTQVQQSEVYRTAIGYWRRLKADPAVHTMGVLYWQLNDIWAGPSWSSINYQGRWKMLQYTLRDVFAPLYIFGEVSEDKATLNIYAVSDVNLELNVQIEIQVIKFDSHWDQSIPEPTKVSTTLQQQDVYTTSLDLKQILTNAEITQPNQAFIHLKIYPKYTNSTEDLKTLNESLENLGISSDQLESSSEVWLCQMKEVDLQGVGFFVKNAVQDSKDGSISFEVNTNSVSPFVQFETEYQGVFSRSGFTMAPFEYHRITFFPWEQKLRLDDFLSSLRFMCMNYVHDFKNNASADVQLPVSIKTQQSN
eukprot:TRINITY_DN5161_c0_g1_i1.p1 TRINITY_DN5161_c0_g1~~TRINITY_DN5161_c0_g1_i1.p1  ORF type:complete len:411 (+),score=54.61 TRINITY_DN5161_c0_g1_i1:174-1235(+)